LSVRSIFLFDPLIEKNLIKTTGTSLAHLIDIDDEVPLVCDDPAGGQSLRFASIDGRQVITYSYLTDGVMQEVRLSDSEASELNAWRNNGRRTSYWDWPGWGGEKTWEMKYFETDVYFTKK